MKLIILFILIIILILIYISVYGTDNFPFYDLYKIKSQEYQKKQWVRILDIILLGPAAIIIGYHISKNKCEKWKIIPYLLYIYAFFTIIYNYTNFYNNLKYS